MNWSHFLNQGKVERHDTTKREIDDLRGLVARNLKDASLPRLSADNRLGLSYEAGLILAKMAICCAGYRVKGPAHHKTMFEALPLAMGPSVQDMADFLEQCRRNRNAISYDAAGMVGDGEAAAAHREVVAFEIVVESWIIAHHAAFRR